MNTLEIMTAERLPGNDIKLSTTGRQPFSISETSPGFRLLVQLLSTPKAYVGYATPLMPALKSLGGHCLEVQYLVNQGTAHQGGGSWVFRVKLEADRAAILKLNRLPQEVNMPSITKQDLRLFRCRYLYALFTNPKGGLHVVISWL